MTSRTRKAASVSHEEVVIDELAKDPAFAAEYLSAVLADGNVEELLLGLRRVTQAHGGVAKVASRAKLNPTSLYRALSASGNPEIRSLSALLRAMGMCLAIQPVNKAVRRRRQVSPVT